MGVDKRKVCVCALVASFLLLTSVMAIPTDAQQTPIAQAVQASHDAYASIKAADTAGANVTVPAAQFNLALSLLENATELEKRGNESQALSLASEAQGSFQAIIPESQHLRDQALARQEESSRLQTLSIPVAALIIAIVTVLLFTAYQRIRVKQFNELRINLKPRS